MTTDLDSILDRRATPSLKWDRHRNPSVIPIWVADMDFAAPPPILHALRERLEYGVLGYAIPTTQLVATVCSHLAREYAWTVDPDWLVWLPGVVPGLNASCRESRLSDPAGFLEANGVGLADGPMYGSPGFVRLNFACPRARLVEALDGMENGLRQR